MLGLRVRVSARGIAMRKKEGKGERKRTDTYATDMMTEGAGVLVREERVKRDGRKSTERTEVLEMRVVDAEGAERGKAQKGWLSHVLRSHA